MESGSLARGGVLSGGDRMSALSPEPSVSLAELFARANALREQGRWDEAVAAFRAVLARAPAQAEALLNLGLVLEKLGQFEEAEATYRSALAAQPERPEAYFNLSNVLLRRGRPAESVAALERALALRPDFPEALVNLGNFLRVSQQLDASEAAYARALALRPDYAEAWVNLGNVFRARNDMPRAFAAYERALALHPTLAQAHLNQGLAYLVTGELLRGWQKAEYRGDVPGTTPTRRLPAPRWRGDEPFAGRTILLHAEQGLGDTLQFVRYVPMVAALGATVLLEVQPALRTLLAGYPGAAAVLAHGEALPAFDYECPLLSLPLAFGTELATAPAATPYVHPPAAHASRWRDWAARILPPRVGVVWAGNPGHPNDANRSIPLELFRTVLADFAAARFVCLQKEIAERDAAAMRACQNLLLRAPELVDFADTAGLVAQLDLVIAVDSAVAHLAGAMGRPVWLLVPFSPDWRWLLGRTDSPWYSATRLFRQPRLGDWQTVLTNVRSELQQRYGPVLG